MNYTMTLPHAGDYWIAFEHLMRRIGYKVKVPPKTSRKTLDLGVKFAPEQACLPFKVTIGNIIEGLNSEEINYVLMIGGRTGMCRLAYYAQLYKKILVEKGYQFELFNFKLKKEMWKTIKNHFPQTKLRDFIKYFYEFWLKLKLLEFVRDQTFKYRPVEQESGSCTKLYNSFLKKIARANEISELKSLKKLVKEAFTMLPLNKKRKTIKIGLVGEFFLLIDQFSTMELEVFLGQLGAEVHSTINFSEFIVGSIKQVRFLDKFIPTERHKIAKYAKPYINKPIGGHAMQSIGHTIAYKKMGFDGVIHLYPFTCMPEIVAESILHDVSKNNNIPVLSLSLDEHTGLAGLHTRVEAFVDMILRKKKSE